MGVGGLSVIVPTFNAQLAPPSVRGTLVGLQQVAICCERCWNQSIMVIPLIVESGHHGIVLDRLRQNYINGTTYPQQSSAAWRISLALKLVPAIVFYITS